MRTPGIGFTWLILLSLTFRALVEAADRIACYYGTWARFSGLQPSQIPPDLCTSILVAFVQVRASDLQTIVPFDSSDPTATYPALRNLRSQSTVGLKIIIALGGATHDNSRIVSVTNDPILLATFASNTIGQLRTWGMDGLDVDWEFPTNKITHTTFMTALRTAIDNEVLGPNMERLELSAALPAGKQFIDPGYDVPALANLLDIGYVMGYDYHGPWESMTGHNSPLKPRQADANQNLNVKWSVEYWNSLGLPKSKLYVGMPTYGRSFTLTSNAIGVNAPSSPGVGEFWTYRETCSIFLPDIAALEFWDSESEVPYAVNVDSRKWLSYSNITSIANKCQWVADNQYAGAMVWSLHQEDYDSTCGQGQFPLVTAVRSCTDMITTQTTTRRTTVQTTTSSNFCADQQHDSLHEIPGNCLQFYHCVEGITFTQNCPLGLHFTETCSCCDFPANANRTDCDATTTTTMTTTTTSSTTGMITSSMSTPSSTSPTMTTTTLTSTPSSSSSTITTAMSTSSTTLTTTSTPTTVCATVPPGFCAMNGIGFHAIPNNCTHYVWCLQQTFIFSCSVGLWWDQGCTCCRSPNENPRTDCDCMTTPTTASTTATTSTTSTVTTPSTTSPQTTSPSTTTTTPTTASTTATTSTVTTPSTTSPQTTSPSTTTTMTTTTTPPTQSSTTTATTSPPTSTTQPTPSSTPNTSACANLPDGLYPIPGVCTHYYHCSNGITYVQPCSVGTIFNPDGNFCGLPDNVNRTDC